MGFTGQTTADAQLAAILSALDAGQPPAKVERNHVDVKEEPGRRTRGGAIRPGPADLEAVAQHLHGELACMANTPGGGAIVLGVADDGAHTGATVDPESLRHRIYELSQRRLTPDIRPHQLADGTTVLICRVLQAVEPMRVHDKITWRVADHCVEVDATTWIMKLGRTHHDWSAERSDRHVDDVDPAAMNELRRLLRESSDPHSSGLLTLDDRDLLRRIPNLVLQDGQLTNAGRLLLTEVPIAIDYIHRPSTGADSTIRIEQPGPLLLQLRSVSDAMGARARTVHLKTPHGTTIGQHPALPERAAREAVLNGLFHRDWQSLVPTRVHHVGDTLRVESPGGLVGTVTPQNIISHPSTPRHRALVEAAAKIRLGEREGIGVDRMYADLIALGRPAPVIEEALIPAVRVTLIGGDPDADWVRLRSRLEPAELATDLNVMLALDHVSRHGWGSATSLVPVIQDHEDVADDTLRRLAGTSVDGEPVLQLVKGRPEAAARMYRLTSSVRRALPDRTRRVLAPDSRSELFLSYASDGGRISSTEAADLAAVSNAPAGEVLKQLVAEGELQPSSETWAGRGFHYLPVR